MTRRITGKKLTYGILSLLLTGMLSGCSFTGSGLQPNKPTQSGTSVATTEAKTTEEGTTEGTVEESSGGYICSSGKTAADYEIKEETLERIREVIYREVDASMTRQEQIRAIHDWLVCNVYYDNDLIQHSVDEVMRDGIAVCSGYGDAFWIFMSELEIPCEICTGISDGEAHEWNAVQMEDGYWYYIDVTWDDPLLYETSDYPDGTNLMYNFFLVPRTKMDETHSMENDAPSMEGTEMTYHDWVMQYQTYYDFLRCVYGLEQQGDNPVAMTEANAAKEYCAGVLESGKYALVYYGTDLQPAQLKQILSNSTNVELKTYGEEEREGFFYIVFTVLDAKAVIAREVEAAAADTGYECHYVDNYEDARDLVEDMLQNGEGVTLICTEYFDELVQDPLKRYSLKDSTYYMKNFLGIKHYYMTFLKN